ncbi:MAG: TAT-variant-translocated molybdopterin oxidoreductase [Verrucomicrobiae bacterium]|nr:TAT-variant-translocated molybdopterin oxidoreductase [Verrucomicrobiae bacterium]NNJ85597.1 TAT-variant-translocated molybdopterin oxidoreductase [Akkermansiaceae bacterium]
MSNRKINQPDSPVNPAADAAANGGAKIWRSLGELESTERFQDALDREFPEGSAQMETEEERELSRRSFVKLMGASSALAGMGLAACRRPETLIVPFTQSPEWSVPGKPVYFASSMPRANGAVPLVVTTHDGRPTKLEPNKLFDKQGGTDSFTQASVLDMYDPARSRRFLQDGETKSRADFEKALAEIVAKPESKVGFVFGEDESPTRSRLVNELKAKYAGAKFYSYEPLAGEERKRANTEAFGKGADVAADFSGAKVVLSLDSDFLELDQQGPVSGFYKNRFVEGADYKKKPDAKAMNRLYIVEGGFSLTGGIADHRMRIAPSQVPAIAAAIANELGASVTITGGPELTQTQQDWVKACAADLKKNAGKSVVLAGSRQSKALQDICIAINTALGNYGKTLKPVLTERGDYGDMESLVNSLKANELDTVVLLTPANPAYDADGFAAAAENAQVIHLGLRTDATAHAANWHVPAAHYLESWGDARAADGTLTVVQPLILPLYNGVSEIDLLLAFLDGKLFDSDKEGETTSVSYDAVKKTFAGLADDSEKSWLQFLRDGFWKKSTYAAAAPKAAGTVSVTVPKAPSIDHLEVVFATDGSIYDGRYANNAWLQEAPDPITKVCWDNVAVVSPKTAKDLGVYEKILKLQPKGKVYGIEVENAGVGPDGEGKFHTNPLVKLTVNGRDLEVPLMIGFGHADNVVSLSLGYGQGFDQHDELDRGPCCEGHVSLVSVNRGFNGYALRKLDTPYLATGGKAEDVKKRYSIAMTQEHHAMYGRALAREISTITTGGDHGKDFSTQLEGVKKQGMDSHAPENISLYKPKGSQTWHDKAKADKHLFDERQQWAMTIDLNNCIGCNACLVACQAENNIPVVGKEQVAMGREMHWIRMDRYFAAKPVYENGKAVTEDDGHGHQVQKFDEDNPEMIPQPVACMQCESAPCETVCPVNATVHSEDGLNTMAYNRCIGTRYCANNCPYKARRFNFFDYNKRNPLIHKNLYKGPAGKKAVGEAPHLQRNPNVTVRMRGVMEKCTYCVQRIQAAKGKVKANLKKKATMAGGSSVDVKITDAELRPKLDSIKVACQDACPASAITFGNLQDGDKAQVVRSRNVARNYELLHYIGTLPRTTYLARVKNPNPAMPDAQSVGRATINMH